MRWSWVIAAGAGFAFGRWMQSRPCGCAAAGKPLDPDQTLVRIYAADYILVPGPSDGARKAQDVAVAVSGEAQIPPKWVLGLMALGVKPEDLRSAAKTAREAVESLSQQGQPANMAPSTLQDFRAGVIQGVANLYNSTQARA